MAKTLQALVIYAAIYAALYAVATLAFAMDAFVIVLIAMCVLALVGCAHVATSSFN